MNYLFDWIEDQISNPDVFPSDDEAGYPPMFRDVVKTIFKRLFRMYGHIYCKIHTGCALHTKLCWTSQANSRDIDVLTLHVL